MENPFTPTSLLWVAWEAEQQGTNLEAWHETLTSKDKYQLLFEVEQMLVAFYRLVEDTKQLLFNLSVLFNQETP